MPIYSVRQKVLVEEVLYLKADSQEQAKKFALAHDLDGEWEHVCHLTNGEILSVKLEDQSKFEDKDH